MILNSVVKKIIILLKKTCIIINFIYVVYFIMSYDLCCIKYGKLNFILTSSKNGDPNI